jgi:hypothetical protein
LKKNGAIYAGNFLKGRAEGPGACVFADGSYYEGEMADNVAETTCGHFQNATFTIPMDFTSTIFTATAAKKDITTNSQRSSGPAKENSPL